MKDFKRDLLNEFIEKDLRIRNLYNQIRQHPNHKRQIRVIENYNSKGKICYLKSEVNIEIDITLGEESIIIFAHELMHYLLVLKGALLPIKTKDVVSNTAESLKYYLSKGITHHLLLKQQLDLIGFAELQIQYALGDELHEMPKSYYFNEDFWLLELFDRSTFAKDYNFKLLRQKFDDLGLISVFELLRNSKIVTISDINELSRCLIKEFKCEDSLQLTDLEGFTSSGY